MTIENVIDILVKEKGIPETIKPNEVYILHHVRAFNCSSPLKVWQNICAQNQVLRRKMSSEITSRMTAKKNPMSGM